MEQEVDLPLISDPGQVDDEAILAEQMAHRQAKWNEERTVVLRLYNYFRIVLSFLLIILFYEVPDQTFVGTLEPGWFQTIILTYLILNVTAGFAVLISKSTVLTNATSVGSIVILDIFFLSLLLFTSGGISGGLGYLLVFTVAFGSVMLGGQYSLVFPSVATVNMISGELYLHNTGQLTGSQHFF